jgi:hypothetical protein
MAGSSPAKEMTGRPDLRQPVLQAKFDGFSDTLFWASADLPDAAGRA